MAILFNNELKEQIKDKLNSVESSILILSAFVKLAALESLLEEVQGRMLDITIVSRWQLQDLVSGASDVNAYRFARQNGWQFLINPNLHYKIYLIDQKSLFVGSANLTQKGLNLGMQGNDEATIQVTPTAIDVDKLNRYTACCCVMNDDLFVEMKTVVERAEASHPKGANISWPTKIKETISPVANQLWVNDLIFNSPASIKEDKAEHTAHDLHLLGLAGLADFADSKKVLSGLRVSMTWLWLIKTIAESEYEFVRFGELTTKLHAALVDDPKPYRKDVKGFLANLYEWIRYLDPPEIGIKKFNHTEALFLRNGTD